MARSEIPVSGAQLDLAWRLAIARVESKEQDIYELLTGAVADVVGLEAAIKAERTKSVGPNGEALRLCLGPGGFLLTRSAR